MVSSHPLDLGVDIITDTIDEQTIGHSIGPINRNISSYKIRPRGETDEPTRGVIRRCSSFHPTGRRSISFAKEHDYFFIECLDEFVKEEFLAYWYTHQECDDMKEEAAGFAAAIDAGFDDVDIRGIEEKTAEGAWEAMQARNRGYNLVLGEQERQQRVQENDAEAIARLFAEVSEESSAAALQRAKADEEFAMEFLACVFTECRALNEKFSPLAQKSEPQRRAPSKTRSEEEWESLLVETQVSLRTFNVKGFSESQTSFANLNVDLDDETSVDDIKRVSLSEAKGSSSSRSLDFEEWAEASFQVDDVVYTKKKKSPKESDDLSEKQSSVTSLNLPIDPATIKSTSKKKTKKATNFETEDVTESSALSGSTDVVDNDGKDQKKKKKKKSLLLKKKSSSKKLIAKELETSMISVDIDGAAKTKSKRKSLSKSKSGTLATGELTDSKGDSTTKKHKRTKEKAAIDSVDDTADPGNATKKSTNIQDVSPEKKKKVKVKVRMKLSKASSTSKLSSTKETSESSTDSDKMDAMQPVGRRHSISTPSALLSRPKSSKLDSDSNADRKKTKSEKKEKTDKKKKTDKTDKKEKTDKKAKKSKDAPAGLHRSKIVKDISPTSKNKPKLTESASSSNVAVPSSINIPSRQSSSSKKTSALFKVLNRTLLAK